MVFLVTTVRRQTVRFGGEAPRCFWVCPATEGIETRERVVGFGRQVPECLQYLKE